MTRKLRLFYSVDEVTDLRDDCWNYFVRLRKEIDKLTGIDITTREKIYTLIAETKINMDFRFEHTMYEETDEDDENEEG